MAEWMNTEAEPLKHNNRGQWQYLTGLVNICIQEVQHLVCVICCSHQFSPSMPLSVYLHAVSSNYHVFVIRLLMIDLMSTCHYPISYPSPLGDINWFNFALIIDHNVLLMTGQVRLLWREIAVTWEMNKLWSCSSVVLLNMINFNCDLHSF